MQYGDIVIYYPKKSASWVARAIAWLQPRIGQGGSKNLPSASHCSIMADNPEYEYESTIPKSRYHKISDEDKKNFVIEVYRFDGITIAQRRMVLRYCQNNMDRWYDYLEIFTLGLLNLRFFDACSEFVRKAYNSAGIQLGRGDGNEYLLSPNELLYDTKKLKKVCDLNG